MIKTVILIIFITYGQSGSLTTIKFQTQEECLAAGRSIQEEFKPFAKTVCIEVRK